MIKDYFKPKSMIYTGKHLTQETKIKHYHYNKDKVIISDSFERKEHYKSYIQVIGLADVEKIQTLRNVFSIDPMIMEDIFNVHQRNKIEWTTDHLFGVFHVSYLLEDSIQHDYMSVLLFQDALISFHEREPIFLAPFTSLFDTFEELRKSHVDFLFYEILDMTTDHHLAVYEHLDDKISEFESEILETRQVNQESFYAIRKELLTLSNNIHPILEELADTLSKPTAFLSNIHQSYFEDLKDHLLRLDNHLSQSRELMRHLLDLHMNNQSTKMNRIMTTLTLFSAIFIPLSFLTGFFGMNFVHFQILQYEHALLLFSGACLVLALLMILFFKKMKWF